MTKRSSEPTQAAELLRCTDDLKSAAHRLLARLSASAGSKTWEAAPRSSLAAPPDARAEGAGDGELRPVRLGLGATRSGHDAQAITNPAILRMKGKVAGLKRQRDRENEDLDDVREKRKTVLRGAGEEEESRSVAVGRQPPSQFTGRTSSAPPKLILSKDELKRQRKKENKRLKREGRSQPT